MQACKKDILNPSERTNRFLSIGNKQPDPDLEQFLRDSIMCTMKENDNDEDEQNFQHSIINKEERKKFRAQHNMLMDQIQARKMFICMRRFKKICKKIDNKFVTSSFTTYIANNYKFMENYNDSVNEWHNEPDDLKYIIDLCGSKLTCLCVEDYQFSYIMPFINNNCPNLRQLRLKFKEIKSEDFENVFSNMSNLKGLEITWACDNSTLPDTLVDSLKQVGRTLKYLNFKSHLDENDIFLPESLASVFLQLIALENLKIYKFKLTQPILESIGEMENLIKLHLHPDWIDRYTVYHDSMNMYPIGNLKTLESLIIEWDCDITDEFLINLCNNAKNLQELRIAGTKLTDRGIIAVNNLKQLKVFWLLLHNSLIDGKFLQRNEFITDESIQSLHNNQLESLTLSNCIKITDRSVTELVKNLPNLRRLYLVNTDVSSELAKEIRELTKRRENPISVYASDKNRPGSFKTLSPSVQIYY